MVAYCIAYNNKLCIDYIHKTKKGCILKFRLDDADRMSWKYHKQNSANCVKIHIAITFWGFAKAGLNSTKV